MALEMKTDCEKCGRRSTRAVKRTSAFTNALFAAIARRDGIDLSELRRRVGARPRAAALPAIEANRAATSARDVDPISQETFVADHAHLFMTHCTLAGRNSLLSPAQCGRVRAAEQLRRDRQIELIDQSVFKHRTKKSRRRLRRRRVRTLYSRASLKHLDEDRRRESRSSAASLFRAALFATSRGIRLVEKMTIGEISDWKIFSDAFDPAFVRNDHAQRRRRLSAFRLAPVAHLPKPSRTLSRFKRAMTDEHRIGQRALAEQVQFVFARSEIDRREIVRGDLAVGGHRECRADKWTR